MKATPPLRVGILGLGRIGRVVATNLQASGFSVATVDRPSTRDFAATGGSLKPDAARLASESDIVVSALASEAQMEEAFLSPAGLLAGTHRRLIVIEMGTFPIALKRRLADAMALRGGAMLDCPVSGDRDVVERAAPVLDGISARRIYVGAFGAGTATKLVANFLVTSSTLALAEAFVLGTKSGLDPKLMIEAIGNSFAGSHVFDFRAPMMATRTYRPAPGPANIVWKDLQYIREQSDALHLATPVLNASLEWYGRLVNEGRGEDECAAVYEILLAESARRLADR